MKKLVILGGRGIGMIAASVANDLGNYQVLGFLNDFVGVGDDVGKYKKYKVILILEHNIKVINNPYPTFNIGKTIFINP